MLQHPEKLKGHMFWYISTSLIILFWHEIALAFTQNGIPYEPNFRRILVNIILVIFVVTSVMFYALYCIKRSDAKKALNTACESDNHWGESKLQYVIEETFHELFIAYQQRKIDNVLGLTSESFHSSFKHKFIGYEKGLMTYYLEEFEYSGCQIVAVNDYHDNTLDCFSVLVMGGKIEYLVFEPENNIVSGSKELIEFRSVWHFKRHQNTWLLDKIDDHAEFSDLKQLNSSVE